VLILSFSEVFNKNYLVSVQSGVLAAFKGSQLGKSAASPCSKGQFLKYLQLILLFLQNRQLFFFVVQ
jgi:hypothetical protein